MRKNFDPLPSFWKLSNTLDDCSKRSWRGFRCILQCGELSQIRPFEKERESKISAENYRSSSQHCWQWHCNNTKILVSSLVSTRGHRYTGVCRSISRCRASSFNFKLFPAWSLLVTFDSTLKLAEFSNFYACNFVCYIHISIFDKKKIASAPWINRIENKSLFFYVDHIIHISYSMNNLDLSRAKLRNM